MSDRLLDLRSCKLPGAKLDGKTLSGALMSEGVFDGASMTEAVLSKAYARGASFKGANFSNAVLDRLDWTGADLRWVKRERPLFSVSMHPSIRPSAPTSSSLTLLFSLSSLLHPLSGVNFTNAVITGGLGLETVTFDDKTIFEDALIGNEDAKKLCLNPTLRGLPRSQVGCRGG